MTARDWMGLTAGRSRIALEDGMQLRLLSALEVLEAGREAAELADEEREEALCANACLLARALERRGRPVFSDGRAALEGLSPGQIAALAGRWADFDAAANRSATGEKEQVDALKKSLQHAPYERLKWRVLRSFGALPTEARAREMKHRDYLWCALHLMLDEEEERDLLCPVCRDEAEQARCPACGTPTEGDGVGQNAGFDAERFERLRRGEGS